jgi:Tol biopolymer transport system component
MDLKRLGPYDILSPLGAGGMGEVYRAKDTKLGREVALKLLPATFTTDPERIARFRREAQVLASLNHPHIGAIYGLDEANGQQFLVLELVDGESLDRRITRGPIPVDEAVGIAKEIAEALEAAHEKGIIHRDLKPANVAVARDGTVKVLDFGLAKAAEPASGASLDVTNSPTITTPAVMTGVGVVLGTAAYMSPEQAKGKPADRRSDIWAFGCVLFEMVTGKRAFDGEDVSDTLANVLKSEPDWTAVPFRALGLTRLLRRCLDKDRKRRLADIADTRFDLDEALRPDTAPGHDFNAAANLDETQARGKMRLVGWSLAGAAALIAVATIVFWAPWKNPAPRAALRLTAEFGANISLAANGASALALSSDGSALAFIGQLPGGEPQLYLRRLNQLTATPLAGTDGASAPFFSPDGQWLAYFAGGKLKKIPVTGGASIALCDAPSQRGGAWSDDGTIVFAPASPSGLFRVSASGGTSEPATKLAAGEVTHRWPQILERGKAVLFTASRENGQYEDATLVMQQLPDGPRKVLVTGGYFGRYLPSGHLVYIHAATLFANPFDLRRFEIDGPSAPAVEGVNAIAGTGAAQFAVSTDGTLVYAPGEGENINAPLVWLDSHGQTAPLRTTRSNWGNVRFSPDGRRLALNINGPQRQIWVYEWAHDALSQLTFDPSNGSDPVWSPDGKDIAFTARRGSDPAVNLYVQHADGTGAAVRLTNSPNNQAPTSWHPSGKWLAYAELRQGSGSDLMILPINGDSASGWKAGKPEVFLANPWPEFDTAFSPDGRWVAYSSAESGRSEVFVQPFPAAGGKWKISAETGGRYPVWSRTGHELMFGALNGARLMAVSYSVGGNSFRPEKPRVWAEGRIARLNGQRGFDLHPDGNRVVISGAQADAQAKQDKAVFVFNFFDELRRIAPMKR